MDLGAAGGTGYRGKDSISWWCNFSVCKPRRNCGMVRCMRTNSFTVCWNGNLIMFFFLFTATAHNGVPALYGSPRGATVTDTGSVFPSSPQIALRPRNFIYLPHQGAWVEMQCIFDQQIWRKWHETDRDGCRFHRVFESESSLAFWKNRLKKVGACHTQKPRWSLLERYQTKTV